MEIKLTPPEIRAIFQGCQYTLQLVGSTQDYREIQLSEHFSTSNNVVLNDAVSVLYELVEAIEQMEQFSQQGESGHGARN